MASAWALAGALLLAGSAWGADSTTSSVLTPAAHDARLVGVWSLEGGTLTLGADGQWAARQGAITITGPAFTTQAGVLTMQSADPQDTPDRIHYRFLPSGALELTGDDGHVVTATRVGPTATRPRPSAAPAPSPAPAGPASGSTSAATLPAPPPAP